MNPQQDFPSGMGVRSVCDRPTKLDNEGRSHSPAPCPPGFHGKRKIYDEVVMRIEKEQVVAGNPALTVRTLLRRYRSFTIVPATAAYDLKVDEREGSAFLKKLSALDLVEPGAPAPNLLGLSWPLRTVPLLPPPPGGCW